MNSNLVYKKCYCLSALARFSLTLRAKVDMDMPVLRATCL